MDHLFDMRPDRPGYRLQRLEVFNWGTFDSADGRIHRFEPQGRTSLLVGHNGSGKSTLVDAILTLLVDSRSRNYNVAAGAKKTERTPKSYIKGAFDRTADESQASVVRYLRPRGNHFTALSAVFRDEHLDRAFTLTQILYLKGDGSDEKVYALADEERELKEVLAGLAKSDEVRDHLKQQGYQTTKTYVEYLGWITRRTGMRGKGIDMFNQTVHVKDIQSLNAFIRRHMLEAQDWRDKVQRLLTHFNDLSLAHQELVRARRAQELLEPVEELGNKYRQRAGELDALERQLEAATSYFPVQVVRLLEPAIDGEQAKAAAVASQIVRLDGDLKAKREAIRQLTNEIEQAGGERLRQIPGLIQQEEIHLQHKKLTFAAYHDELKTCGMTDVVNTPQRFAEARRHLEEVAATATRQIEELRGEYEQGVSTKGSLEVALRREREELEILERRKTNLPPQFMALRSRLCEDLGLDESTLPFVAELVAVAPEERRWEASAEMVLRSFALSLLVPERYYRRVRAYVENTRLEDSRGEGQRLDYLCVGKPNEPTGDRIDRHSLIEKLVFKPRHDLVPWVRGELARRFDFRCCDSVEEFNDVRRMAITANRHVKFSSARHQKDDRPRTVDPRHFVLGWDNREKKRRIAEGIAQLESQLAATNQEIARVRGEIDQQDKMCKAAMAGLAVKDFDTIDLGRHEREIANLRAEQKELIESSDAVRTLSARLKRMEAEVEELGSQRDRLLQEKGELEAEIKRVQQLLQSALAEVRQAERTGELARHEPEFEGITASLGNPPLSLEDVFLRRDRWKEATSHKLAKLRKPLEELADKLRGKMVNYLREFREETADLDATMPSLDSFLERLEQLRREDLPRYEKKFKDRLNDQVSTEIAVFNTELREESKQLKQRIGLLNEALAAVEYNRGTLMRLEPRPVQDREIEDFRRALRECLDESLEATDEANEARFRRIKALVERLSDKERTAWRNKVIDVRNWYDFAAQEIDRTTGELHSSYDGSSGQSGGEKAKLAFTILVAALAYQFDVDPHGHTPGRFHFVVIDEMFSKVDDQNAQYALKLFEQFGLQLLIVAPLDAKARVTEPFVDRYLHTVKDPVTSCSQLFSMTAQEYEEVVRQVSPNGNEAAKRRVTAK